MLQRGDRIATVFYRRMPLKRCRASDLLRRTCPGTAGGGRRRSLPLFLVLFPTFKDGCQSHPVAREYSRPARFSPHAPGPSLLPHCSDSRKNKVAKLTSVARAPVNNRKNTERRGGMAASASAAPSVKSTAGAAAVSDSNRDAGLKTGW
jgi:hypothetical protein